MATRRGKARGNGGRPSNGRARKFTVPIKLFVTPEMYKQLETRAEEREWSVPQVIRCAVREAEENWSSR